MEILQWFQNFLPDLDSPRFWRVFAVLVLATTREVFAWYFELRRLNCKRKGSPQERNPRRPSPPSNN